ncbi:MAG: hypothetical protein Q9179_005614 [Wetmoreana sp. 5 TL-2023]
MYHTSTTFAKYSILAFYHRIFPVPHFRRILYIIAAVVTCFLVSGDLVCLFQCIPVHSFWDVDVPGYCINIDRFFIGIGSVNVVLDFIIFILPIPLLWRLRTSFNQKIVLTLIFTVAGFVVIVSIVRVIVLSRIGTKDLTWIQSGNYINGGIWTETEPSVAVICACLPSLRPLFSSLSSNPSAKPSNTSSRYRLWRRDSSGYRECSCRGARNISSKDSFSRPESSDPEMGVSALGHNVSVQADAGEGKEGVDVPERGIQVKTEVVIVNTESLEYRDRLF